MTLTGQAYRSADQFLPPSRAAWRYVLRKARHLIPLDKPVRVRKTERAGADTGEWWGAYSARGKLKGHTIWISPRLPLNAAVDALIHEMTHAWLEENPPIEAGEPTDTHRDHGDAFWLTFGKFYRAWMEETSI